MSDEFDYEKDLAIDPHQLDEEILRQPVLYAKYANEVPFAQAERDRAKENLETIRADLDKKIRTDPEKYELKKVTESAVANAIIVHPDYQKASNVLIEANKKLNLTRVAPTAFEHRKKALEGMISLFVGNYFSGPKEPRELPPGQRFADKAMDKVANEARTKLNRSRRRKLNGE